MPSLRQAARAAEHAGEPLPYTFPSLRAHGVALRRGHLHVVASAPGVGKSVSAINWTLWNEGVPALYLAMDGDATSMSMRVLQAYFQRTREEIQDGLDFGDPAIESAFDTIDWVRWDFPNSPSMEEIRDRVWAFAEIFGEFPHLIVVDNLMDVVVEQTAAAYAEAEMALAALARAANAAVLALAHLNGSYEGSNGVVPMSGLNFKPTKKSSLILSAYPGGFGGGLWMSVLKNRDGPADPSGIGVRAKLDADYSRMKCA